MTRHETETHPSPNALSDFVLGKSSDSDDATIESHLAICTICQHYATNSIPNDPFVTMIAGIVTRVESHSRTLNSKAILETPTDHREGGSSEFLPDVLNRHPRYRVIRRLGSGGMGTVWLAEHAMMQRFVAIKVIHPGFLTKSGAVERFHREVRAAARLSHVNVVTSFDAEELNGTHFLVMEFVPGESLQAIVARGPLPIPDACRAIRDAARGLAHAHDFGLIHRDVKPSNLIRTPDGVVKILDFGLVPSDRGETSLTGPNLVIGTPDYIAPEQANDPSKSDRRADLYSLGCTFYHLLSGHVPYPSTTVLKVIDSHRDLTTRPRAIPDLPKGLAMILDTMMAKHPAQRFASAAEVAEALEPYCHADWPTQTQPVRKRIRSLFWVMLALFASAIIAFTVILTIKRDNETITIESNDPDVELVSRKNGDLVKITDRKTNQSWDVNIATKQLAIGQEQSIDLPGQEPMILRRNGQSIVTIRRSETPLVPTLREVHKLDAGMRTVQALRFSPDSQTVAAAIGPILGADGKPVAKQAFPIRMWDVKAGQVKQTLFGHMAAINSISYSPDQIHLASTSADGQVNIWNLTTNQIERTIETKKPCISCAFSPDGGSLRVMCWNLVPLIFDAATGQAIKPEQSKEWYGDWTSVQYSSDGKQFAMARWGRLHFFEATTDRLLGEVAGLLRLRMSSYSQDGSSLFVVDTNDLVPTLNRVRIFNTSTRKETFNYMGVAGSFLDSTGRYAVISGVLDHQISIWDTKSDVKVADIKGHPELVNWIETSPDRKTVATVSHDKTIRLWELREGIK